jgi:hypothetical protein
VAIGLELGYDPDGLAESPHCQFGRRRNTKLGAADNNRDANPYLEVAREFARQMGLSMKLIHLGMDRLNSASHQAASVRGGCGWSQAIRANFHHPSLSLP